ncbi:MAG: sigma-E factor negative regulatory protein RseA [Gammaproteobacteria bacterium]|jgi:sigma-E factor negative regulatory protein RseA
MSEESKERVSAVVDGELENSSQSTIDSLLQSPELLGTWARYHLVADTLQHQVPDALDVGFAGRISAAIQAEPTILAPTSSKNPILKPVAGFAIAASVAAMAILGIQQNQDRGDIQGQQVVSINPQTTLSRAPVQRVSLTREAEAQLRQAEASTRARLNSYLVNYNEYRTHSGLQGMLPYARTVTFENNK